MNGPLSIVVPVYNEAESLRTLMPELVEFCDRRGDQLVVVDDGSTDRTSEVLAPFAGHPAVQIVRNKLNKGYGGAIKEGIARVRTPFVITIDGDGQHSLDDVAALHRVIQETDADMVVGRRINLRGESLYRKLGKFLIRSLARMLMRLHIRDLNSGMKIYDAAMGRRYMKLCPDSMAYSDIITLVFISQRHRVLEHPIEIHRRAAGVSTISTMTALDTVRELLNIVILFNPMKIFFPLAIVLFLSGVIWGLPIVLQGRGVSVGALLGVISGLIFFLLGLIAEQLSLIRKSGVAEPE